MGWVLPTLAGTKAALSKICWSLKLYTRVKVSVYCNFTSFQLYTIEKFPVFIFHGSGQPRIIFNSELKPIYGRTVLLIQVGYESNVLHWAMNNSYHLVTHGHRDSTFNNLLKGLLLVSSELMKLSCIHLVNH